MTSRHEHEVSIVANAIGFAIYKNSREVMMLNGVETVQLTPVEAKNLELVAAEAIRALDAVRSTEGKRSVADHFKGLQLQRRRRNGKDGTYQDRSADQT